MIMIKERARAEGAVGGGEPRGDEPGGDGVCTSDEE